MKLTDSVIMFIKEHLGDDPGKLILASSRYPELDMKFVAGQITARRQIRDKLPAWYSNEQLIFPSKLAAEQCSSEQTAYYKQQLIEEGITLCDLTGGLGIDSWAFSKKAGHIIYIERFPEYCEVASHNFSVLEAGNISVLKGNSLELLDSIKEKIEIIYLDPARRGEGNKRTYALSDCEPDLTEVLPRLFQRANKVIAKISPMADIRQTIQLLPAISAIHILSVKNECKELLLVLDKGEKKDILLTCWNLRPDGREEYFVFSLPEEECLVVRYTAQLKHYLYEPNSSLLKAGAFKSVTRLGVEKLHSSSHLYTSDSLIPDFPGRIFVIQEVIPFKGKEIKTIFKKIPQANITVRNFPLSVEELRKRLKIKDGGDVYLFATTLADGEKVLINCRKES